MLLSQRKYAESRKARGLSGGTLAAVQKAIASERIQLTDGWVDSDAADLAWGSNTNPSKVQTPGVQTSARAEDPKEEHGSVAKQQLELLTEKTLTARTKRLQLQGEVVAVADVESAIGEMVQVAKNLLLRIPEERADQLAASKDPAECRSILEHDIREALTAIEQKLAA
jgi:hypothetical protein